MREVEALVPMQCALLSERRHRAPAGLAGGGHGSTGRNSIVRGDEIIELPGKWLGELKAGDRLRVETPGGGGWGEPG